MSAGIPAQGSAASALPSFLPSVTFGSREDVAESCNSRSKHTAALKHQSKSFLVQTHGFIHPVIFFIKCLLAFMEQLSAPGKVSVSGREAGLVTGVGDSYGKWAVWTFIPGSALAPVLQISVKSCRNEVQGLSLHVYVAQSVVAPPEHGCSKKCQSCLQLFLAGEQFG